VTAPEIMEIVIGALTGLGASTVFLLALFIGFCVLLGIPKLRSTSRKTLVIRNLDDLDGQVNYFSPTTPRGPVDQLASPELLEQANRKQ
jgi:hypothetical protein